MSAPAEPTKTDHTLGPGESGEGASRKVLIVTYYWPPSGGSGVQRWLKFVKYLPSFGWQPYVFTPENPSFEIRDDSLLRDVPAEAEVLRFPIWEPYQLFRKAAALTGKSTRQTDLITTGKKTWLQGLASWVRGNLFIPDARVFWVKPSVSFLSDFLKSNDIRTLVTTGPPHSMHLIGLKLKKLDPGLRWIVDLRDPWSEWDLLDTLSLTAWARRRHQKLEREVLQKADAVITIAPYHVNRFEKLGGRKVNLITNGFDEDDFRGIERKRTAKFTLRHIGMVDELRDPRPFMEALRSLLDENPAWKSQVEVEFVGSVNASFKNWVASDPELSSVTRFREPVPHAELLKLYGETDVQLLILAHTALAPGNLPGKFFEYLASGNFILGVGPVDGDAAHILKSTHAGEMMAPSNHEGIIRLLAERISQWSAGTGIRKSEVNTFSRRQITRKLSELMEAR
ncbi:MAG: glycosyltransferase family 4 protein [Cyclobacteriaceae bacterium]|nr:glycosyltransferase family 4 protein [Cyclobacteriaceae bacterium]